jgi:hypothetical protein
MVQIKKLLQLVYNMGWNYILFRTGYECRRRSGFLKRRYPTSYEIQNFISLNDWRKEAKPFFFYNSQLLKLLRSPAPELQKEAEDIFTGKIKFFNAFQLDLGKEFDWITNPDTGYKYDITSHWTEVEDISSLAGDIKYVWEKSRFSYLYTLIRYDYHFKKDCSEFVFDEIKSWIAANPLNQGPNYKCSQEISLRVLNWIFALYYYRNSPTLNEESFQQIINSIYWQVKHVFENINFSRKAVRNNHAITETLTLYLVGLLFPWLPASDQWRKKGKAWFEKEIQYQVYEDGTFLQFSMNYHRVVVQLFTWAFYLSKLNKDSFSDIVYERAKKSVEFLYQCQDEESGFLPNYGANDGALFFKLNDSLFRDYRPQLNALYFYFKGAHLYPAGKAQEDALWYSSAFSSKVPHEFNFEIRKKELACFAIGGYYICNEKDYKTFIRCGNHKDRPSQADNLHLDLWYKGKNILCDAGSYKYNTGLSTLRYFMGTASHNTARLEGYDQMEKGARFIWYHWSQMVKANLQEESAYLVFEGTVHAFKHVAKDIFHTRKVIKTKGKAEWEVIDVFNKTYGARIEQIWNLGDDNLTIKAFDKEGNEIFPKKNNAWRSDLYGIKEPMTQLVFTSNDEIIKTIIRLN